MLQRLLGYRCGGAYRIQYGVEHCHHWQYVDNWRYFVGEQQHHVGEQCHGQQQRVG
jgi:hypothetical protein